MINNLERILKKIYPKGADIREEEGIVHIFKQYTRFKRKAYRRGIKYVLHDVEYKDYISLVKKTNIIKQRYIDANPLPLCKNSEYMKLGVEIEDPNKVVIAPFAHIILPKYFNPKVWIGKGSFIGEGAEIRAIEYKDKTITIGDVYIGRNTLIGGFAKISPGSKIAENSLIDINLNLEGEIRGNIKDKEKEIKPNSKMSNKEYLPQRIKLFKKADEVSRRLNLYNKNGTIEYNKKRNEVVIKVGGNKRIEREELSKKILYNPTLSCIFSNIGDDSNKALKPHSVVQLIKNRLSVESVKWTRASKMKNIILRTIGMDVDLNATIKPTKYIEYVAPELSTIKDVMINENVYIVNHLYNNRDFMIGITVVESDLEKGVVIKPGTIIKSGFKTKKKEVYRGYYSK